MVELIWDGKYDEKGKRVAPLRVKLPFQTVETVNASAQQRQMMLNLGAATHEGEWRNRLIWGDKKYILPALLQEFAGKVDLIYIDPPFATGTDFSFEISVNGEDFQKEPSLLEQKAYRDTWGKRGENIDSYLNWMYSALVIMYDLLDESGSIFVHCDYRLTGYVRLLLEEVFGKEQFVNEIIWFYKTGGLPEKLGFGRKHDTIHYFAKSKEKAKWDPQKEKSYLMHKYGFSNIEIFEDSRGQYTLVNARDVFDIPALRGNQPERVDYPTQKPEALLERIIRAASDEGDLILDCFVGSGTTVSVAEKINRRWIACDLGRFAISTTRKRLLSIPGVQPFVVQNLGKYERQSWQVREFGDKQAAEAVQTEYREFILELYHARPTEGYVWLHGLMDGRMVHVGSVDSPVSTNDLKQIAIEFKKAVGSGKDAPRVAAVDILGWDFAFELNEVAKQQAAEANIDMRFLRIPRDVMDPKAVEQGDVKFFELAALSVNIKKKKREIELELTDFVIPPDEVPEDVQKAISRWSQWIDYWAVDWDNKGDTFHNQWQAYRTRQDKSLKLNTSHVYEEPGEYTIMVKVIDILGNDTTKTLKVSIK